MAHTCPDCGCECHCNGDIDDICLDTPEEMNACRHFLNPECCGYEGDNKINPDPEEREESKS